MFEFILGVILIILFIICLAIALAIGLVVGVPLGIFFAIKNCIIGIKETKNPLMQSLMYGIFPIALGAPIVVLITFIFNS